MKLYEAILAHEELERVIDALVELRLPVRLPQELRSTLKAAMVLVVEARHDLAQYEVVPPRKEDE
jgi:hypothetical protein